MKGIEWIKLATYMCEDEKMILIDAMEERDPTHYVWIRLLLQAGKRNDNGLIYLKENVPYTNEMLSILFNRPVPIIKRCLEILESFEMIKIYENNIIKICNWEKHQNIEGMKKVREGTRNRVRDHREKKKMESNLVETKYINNDENKNTNLEKNKVVQNNNRAKKSNKSPNNKNANEGKSLNTNESKTCNASVTLQREKENKNKNKNLDKESRVENKINDEICTEGVEVNPQSEFNIKLKKVSQSQEEGDIHADEEAVQLKKALEETKANIKGLTLNWIKETLSTHEEKYIKMAINIAIEKNKLDVYYITGILKNWLREGYPKTYEEMEFGSLSGDNSSPLKEKPKLRFNNFEARSYDYDDLEKKLLGWKD